MKRLIVFIFVVILTFSVTVDSFGKSVQEKNKEIRNIEKEMMLTGDYDVAVNALKKLRKSYPKDARIYMDMGLAYYGLMKYSKAKGLLQKAQKLSKDDETKNMLASFVSKINGNKTTIDLIEKYAQEMKTSKVSPETKNKMANGHLSMINSIIKDKYFYPSIALPHIIWLEENMPKNVGVYLLSADVYKSARYYDKAKEGYGKAIAMDPNNLQAYKNIADCEVALSNFDEADKYYNKTIDLYLKRGIKKDSPVIKQIEKIKKAFPKKYKDVAGLISDEKYKKAEKLSKSKMSFLRSTDYVALTHLGQIYLIQGKKKEAIKPLRKAIKIAPEYPLAHFYLGKAYFLTQKTKEAMKEFEIFKKQIMLMPLFGRDQADEFAKKLNYIGYLYSTIKRYNEAMSEYRNALKVKPDDQNAYYNMGVAYYIFYHARSKAYNAFNKVLEIDPDSKTAEKTKFAIDYIRSNPDYRFSPNLNFIYDYKE